MIKSQLRFTNYLRTTIKNTSLEVLIPDITTYFSRIKLTKNDFFVKSGMISTNFCFVESGVLQHSILVNEEEKTTYFALKNTCTTSLQSFLKEIPSRKSIKALTECVLWIIDVNDFKKLLINNKAFYQFYFNLLENQIFLIDDYRIDLLTLTPEKRYKKLLINEPNLLQKVPLRYLASFLGISTRNMSRIRKNIK
ncbi:Crp/Fnr family transcriptional regulator [Tenacibaculum sp. nBUS_03]|uniref:Crp/Fnr family transcriptional regulator n=1 Tax=Tenacibaculum sp. nBUS_03 TaxID=3395320 RepID=UPI003EBA6742